MSRMKFTRGEFSKKKSGLSSVSKLSWETLSVTSRRGAPTSRRQIVKPTVTSRRVFSRRDVILHKPLSRCDVIPHVATWIDPTLCHVATLPSTS